MPAGFLVLKSGVSRESSLVEQDVVGLVRERIGPVAAFRTAICVKRLPKTRSGKILRGTMQKIADRQEWKMPATIDDPSILDEIAEVLSLSEWDAQFWLVTHVDLHRTAKVQAVLSALKAK